MNEISPNSNIDPSYNINQSGGVDKYRDVMEEIINDVTLSDSQKKSKLRELLQAVKGLAANSLFQEQRQLNNLAQEIQTYLPEYQGLGHDYFEYKMEEIINDNTLTPEQKKLKLSLLLTQITTYENSFILSGTYSPEHRNQINELKAQINSYLEIVNNQESKETTVKPFDLFKKE